ncbi:ankyrin repeat and SAM domain-containing protein 6 [Diachasma alloeum]|uniref:ankyrin repeat and SAM domain-containing protein 6 n=1 Tax=Diachasma alloeum TaxID=454923 RepID=UPI0007384BD7|nr:ankyrin repeat and SAM domain-containing protein 6 [Diachasma alloeum]
MADVSPPDFAMNDQRYWNENTPPDRIKALPLPPTKWKRYSPSVTMDAAENLIKTFHKMNLDDSVDAAITEGLNKVQIADDSDVNKRKNESTSGKTDSFDGGDSSISSNGYGSNSCVNDSSILNTSEDDRPDTSTPHQSMVSNSKYKMFRPPDLVIEEATNEQNSQEIEDLAQYSPVRSPFPANSSDDSLFGREETPEPLCLESPPKGSFLKANEMRMVQLLKRFGLSHFAIIFIEQEVDVEMFLTLDEKDLKEIGIKKNTDRNVLLSVISECNARLRSHRN